MLSVDEYKRLKELAKKAGINVRLPLPRRLSLSRRDAKKLTTLLMSHERVLVTRRGGRLSFMTWTGYQAVVKNAAKARMNQHHGGTDGK